ncbi:hypothetical protein VitviT2T_017292 [Vitis vinifera]|uniref:Uncharacterized protein n=1 Tax=Vitis vinifera TaxID=29760 RepID=A0ABY9CW42_VITVI|nr:hypothetical protein VitviT2T_017292 [Vitis vinifera]
MVLWIDELEVWVGLESRVEGELNLRGLHMEHSHLSGAKGILWMACFLESNQRNFKDKRCLMLGVIIVLLFHDWKRTAFPRMTSFPEESLKIDVGDMCTHGMEPSLFDFHIHYGVMRAISKSLRISQDEIIKAFLLGLHQTSGHTLPHTIMCRHPMRHLICNITLGGHWAKREKSPSMSTDLSPNEPTFTVAWRAIH